MHFISQASTFCISTLYFLFPPVWICEMVRPSMQYTTHKALLVYSSKPCSYWHINVSIPFSWWQQFPQNRWRGRARYHCCQLYDAQCNHPMPAPQFNQSGQVFNFRDHKQTKITDRFLKIWFTGIWILCHHICPDFTWFHDGSYLWKLVCIHRLQRTAEANDYKHIEWKLDHWIPLHCLQLPHSSDK